MYGLFVAFGHLFINTTVNLDQKKKKRQADKNEIRHAIHNTKGILDYVHFDAKGPSKTTEIGGKHYCVTFVDDFSLRVWVYTMKTKD